MRAKNNRLCIYPKDIQRITGKSYRQSIRLLQKMRIKLNKLEDEFVSIEEFCQFTSLKIEQVEPLIIGQKLYFKQLNFEPMPVQKKMVNQFKL